MTSKIELLKIENQKRHELKQWINLIGSPYNGGGGGVGKLFSASLADGDNLPKIYHQAYNVATIYHTMPKWFKEYFEKAIFINFETLIHDALETHKKDLEKKEKEAKLEYETIKKTIGEVA